MNFTPVDLENTEARPLGTLLWWELADTDTPHQVLADTAAECGYPAIHLPVPVSREIAFSRAIVQGCVNLPKNHGKWRVDLLKSKPTILKTDGEAEAKSSGLLQRWLPTDQDDKTPWRGQAFLTLPAVGDGLVFSPLVPYGPDGDKDPLVAVSLRIHNQFERQRKFATADEIRASVQTAMSRVYAIKVRPGLYFVSTQEGVDLARGAAMWLRCAGNTRAGAIDLLPNSLNQSEAQVYVRNGLKDELHDALRDVDMAVNDLKQGASLRDRLFTLSALRKKIETHAAFLGETAVALQAQIQEAGNLLDAAAKVRDVALEPEIKKGTIAALSRALNAIRDAAATRDVDKLQKATTELRKRQGMANQSAFGDLWSRLRKLSDYALEDDNGFAVLHRAADEVKTYTHLGEEGTDFANVRHDGLAVDEAHGESPAGASP